MIYYQTDGGVAINLYTKAEAKLRLQNGVELKIEQNTDYPNSGKTTFTLSLSRSAHFPIRFRIPRWCLTGARLLVNQDVVLENIKGGAFHTVNRKWKSGDEIRLEMPMDWRVVNGRKAQSGKVAIMRGPVLFSLNPELNKDIDPDAIKLLRLDPQSVSGPFMNATVRPDGIVCRVKAWTPDSYSSNANTELVLTEFPDPEGRASYFLLPNPATTATVEDELLLK